MTGRARARKAILGESLTILCSGALAMSLLLVIGLMGLLALNGLGFFWQKPLAQIVLNDGRKLVGEIHRRETKEVPDPKTHQLRTVARIQVRVGNRDLTGADFLWVERQDIASVTFPPDLVVLERREWGNFFGRMAGLKNGERVLAEGGEAVWQEFSRLHEVKKAGLRGASRLERDQVVDLNIALERANRRKQALLHGAAPGSRPAGVETLEAEIRRLEEAFEVAAARLQAWRSELNAEQLAMEDGQGNRKEIPVTGVVRALRPNQMGFGGKLALYAGRVLEFLFGQPRESNTEGGIFPAIFGTVMMVFIMTIAVTPLGLLAAVYLREYARQGPLVRAVRIAVNNLAGVPSIVFGMFGLGFFVYMIGGTLDRLLFADALPTPTFGTGGILWASLTLALLTVPVVIVATEEGLAAVPRAAREGSLALGATKFETTWKVVVPAAAPGILTGMILAMARAAGEVAPLMIVGMVKLAPALPIDQRFPFVHLERKFMHLGFHIYDVGFQSPNVEATTPIVFATAFLLVLVVTAMNLAAISLRNHLRRKYAASAI